MMTSLYVFSANGPEPFRDSSVKDMIHSHHIWAPDGVAWVYGVVYLSDRVHPLDLVDALTALGVHVLPSVHDTTTVHPEVSSALTKHGVTASDNTHACATKMHAASGMRSLRPHRY